jgi:hypothetical protein
MRSATVVAPAGIAASDPEAAVPDVDADAAASACAWCPSPSALRRAHAEATAILVTARYRPAMDHRRSVERLGMVGRNSR